MGVTVKVLEYFSNLVKKMSTVKTTIEELEKKWDAFADVFAKNIEPQTKITAYNMLSTIRLREVNKFSSSLIYTRHTLF